MNTRGYFDFFKSQPAYKDAEKKWCVELVNSTFFWFDLLINPPQGWDLQKATASFLNSYREAVKNSNDKRFIYFIASRQRVRFSTTRQPKKSLSKSKLIIYVEIGGLRKQKKLSFEIPAAAKDAPLPTISEDGRFILFRAGVNEKPSGISVHEFLMMNDITLGINTEVLYVGSTDDPAKRPIDRDHRGYSDSVYSLSPDETDVFVYYNLFKVISIARSDNSMLNFMVANSLVDEVQRMEEGLLLEHCLIHYFGAKSQDLNRPKEYGKLNNGLKKLLQKHKIQSITFDIEMNSPMEFFRFFSRKITPQDRHHFSLKILDNAVSLTEAEDLYSFL
jgi:hypothetical protein